MNILNVSLKIRETMNLWNKFWFSEKVNRILCLLRIAVGLLLLLKITGIYGFFKVVNFGLATPKMHFTSKSSYFLDEFAGSYQVFNWLPIPSFEQYVFIENVLIISTVFFVIGLFTKIAGPLTAILFLYFFMLSQFFFLHNSFAMAIVLLILAFSPSSDHYSLDAYFKSKKRKNRVVLPIRLIQVLVIIIYAFGAINKLTPGWFNGHVLEVLYVNGMMSGLATKVVLSFFSFKILSLMTIIVQIFLPIGLWVKKTRNFAIIVGILFHLSLLVMMEITNFSFLMIVLLLSFIDFDAKK